MDSRTILTWGCALFGWALSILPLVAVGSDPGQVRDEKALASPAALYQTVTTYDFDPDLIPGDLCEPDMVRVSAHPRLPQASLIRTREGFPKKILDSAKSL